VRLLWAHGRTRIRLQTLLAHALSVPQIAGDPRLPESGPSFAPGKSYSHPEGGCRVERETLFEGTISRGSHPLDSRAAPVRRCPDVRTPPEEDLNSSPDMAPDGSHIGGTETRSRDSESERGTPGTSSPIPLCVTRYAEAPILSLFDLFKPAIVIGIAVGVWYLL